VIDFRGMSFLTCLLLLTSSVFFSTTVKGPLLSYYTKSSSSLSR